MNGIWVAVMVLAFIVSFIVARRGFKRKDYNKACFCLLIAILVMIGGVAMAQMGLL